MLRTQAFKDTVKARAQTDAAFRVGLLDEALDAFVNNDLEIGKLASRQAARLVGMARVAFLSELGRLDVSAIQIELDDLVHDLAAAEAAAGYRPRP
jgi:hypothetical protein